MINVSVEKSNNENSVSLIRRFTKKVQESGVLPRVRSIRYSSRAVSENVKRKKTLKRLKKKEEIAMLLKLGKIREIEKGKKRK